MLGGYQILDLTNINLELGADAVDITDSGVLKQLLNLREYIEKGYDFSRPLNNQLKPFQVRYRDKKADEEITATLWASLLVIDSGFIISASIPNYANLEIFVSFSEETDDDGNNYWAIDSAQVKYSLISSGTKLYKHILFDSDNDYKFEIISTSSSSLLENVEDINDLINRLNQEDVLYMLDLSSNEKTNLSISSLNVIGSRYLVKMSTFVDNDTYYITFVKYDDIIFESLTDTVTEL